MDYRELTIPLFPLNDTVFFPHTLLPLNIFEPRYRAMTEDALAGDRRIGMILPRPDRIKFDDQGFLADDAPLVEIGGLGRIFNERRSPDGRFQFVLRGETRFEILEEIDADVSYRRARVRLLDDYLARGYESRRRVQRAEIVALLRGSMETDESQVKQFLQYLLAECPPGVFVDMASYASPIEVIEKQALLETPDVDKRLETLCEFLRERLVVRPRSSPFQIGDFSVS